MDAFIYIKCNIISSSLPICEGIATQPHVHKPTAASEEGII